MNDDLEYLIEKEQLQLASLPKRALAYTIDELLLALLLLAGMWEQFSTAENIEKTLQLAADTTVFILFAKLLYHALFIKMYGSTLGKMVVRIRVVQIDTLDNPGWPAALWRSVIRLFGESLFYLGFLWAVFDPFLQAWHDKIAKTLVIDAQ